VLVESEHLRITRIDGGAHPVVLAAPESLYAGEVLDRVSGRVGQWLVDLQEVAVAIDQYDLAREFDRQACKFTLVSAKCAVGSAVAHMSA